jgi:hypothetical protein
MASADAASGVRRHARRRRLPHRRPDVSAQRPAYGRVCGQRHSSENRMQLFNPHIELDAEADFGPLWTALVEFYATA